MVNTLATSLFWLYLAIDGHLLDRKRDDRLGVAAARPYLNLLMSGGNANGTVGLK